MACAKKSTLWLSTYPASIITCGSKQFIAIVAVCPRYSEICSLSDKQYLSPSSIASPILLTIVSAVSFGSILSDKIVFTPTSISFLIFLASAGPDMIASKHPFRPHPHNGPSGSTTMWPSSAKRPVAPAITLPSEKSVPPTPSATFRYKTDFDAKLPSMPISARNLTRVEYKRTLH